MTDAGIWLDGLLAIAIVAGLAWIASVVRRDAGVADIAWSLLIAAAAFAYAMGQDETARTMLVLSMTAVWAARLALHIGRRSRGHPEDRRYRDMRARHEPGFAWKSLYLVFGLQALIAWIISLPLLGALRGHEPLGWLDVAGVLLWLAGFLYETIADWQLLRFSRNPDNRGKVLNSGLWRYSRHPNYFGEFLVWWGFFLVAWSAGAGWSVISPIIVSVLLLRVSGVPLLEKDIGERRPGYRAYVLATNAFFPGPPRNVQPPENPPPNS